jgi:cobalt/nickel transport system permease protein
LHYLVLDTWSRRDSVVHRREARAKLIAVLLVLVWMGTAAEVRPEFVGFYGGLLAGAALLARLPLLGLLARAALVLPLAATFAAISALGGDPGRAVALLVKSLFSSYAVLLLAATTRLPELLRGVERLGAPRMLVMVVQFLYRYLFVLSETAQHMRLAAQSRGGWRWSAAGGAAAVLFGSAYARAEGIHRAMLARGFTGHIEADTPARIDAGDAAMLALVLGALAAARLLWRL